MGDNDENGTNSNESYPYLYVHILPKETGAKPQREIIPADVIKKFKYETYKNNKNIYKETKFSFRRGPCGEKLKCYVLYAADSYHEVLTKSISKRFSVPTYSTTIDDIENSHQLHDSTNVSNQGNEDNDKLEEYSDNDIVDDQDDDNRKKMLSNNKRKLKKINKDRKKQKVDRENNVLKKYINQRQNESVSDIEDPSFFTPETSTLTKDVSNIPRQKDGIAELSKKANSYKNLYIAERKKNEDLRNMIRELQPTSENHNPNEENAQHINMQSGQTLSRNNNESDSHSSVVNPFYHYDTIYTFDSDEKLNYDEFGNVLLAHGVPCNPKAYNDSWKTKSPSKCLAILSQGVYEFKNLAEPCVRKQKNNKDKKRLDPLKTVALEKQVYKFMRIKNLSIEDIEYFLQRLNTVHNQCINKARKRCKTLESFNEENVSDDEDMDYRGPLKG